MHKLQFGAAAVGLLAAVIAAVGGTTAAAAQPTAATIQENSVFQGSHQGPAGTFTAAGIPDCASGTFSDQLVSFNPNGTRPVIDRTYVCDSGGTLTVRVALHLSTVDAAGVQTTDGTWRIIDATGSLAELAGSGSDTGLNSGCSPIGTAFGECTTGAGTVTAWLSLRS